MRTRPASLTGDETPAAAPPAPPKPASGATRRRKTAAEEGPQPIRFYQVEGGPLKAGDPNKVGPFRRDQGDFFITLGSEISSTDYDIKSLRAHGCKLKEIEVPGWFLDQQDAGEERAAELRAAGIPVPPTSTFEPVPLEGSKKPARTEGEAA